MVDRRTFLGYGLGTAISLHAWAADKVKPEPYSDPAVTENWIRKWMSASPAATGTLHLGRFADRYYYLLRPIDWAPDKGRPQHPAVSVPKGFVTDFASVPRVFWTLLPPDGLYTYPAIVHDYLYWFQPLKKDEADEIFSELMREFNVGAASRNTIYAGVRAGGQSAWDDNATRRNKGEKRILVQEPDSPLTTWETWRQNPAHFAVKSM